MDLVTPYLRLYSIGKTGKQSAFIASSCSDFRGQRNVVILIREGFRERKSNVFIQKEMFATEMSSSSKKGHREGLRDKAIEKKCLHHLQKSPLRRLKRCLHHPQRRSNRSFIFFREGQRDVFILFSEGQVIAGTNKRLL